MYSYTSDLIIKNLCNDILYIINQAPKKIIIFREKKIYNNEEDAVIRIEEEEVGTEIIRIWQEPIYRTLKNNDGSVIEIRQWQALAHTKSLIKKDDILRIENKRFRVVEMTEFSYLNIVYKYNLKIEEVV